MIAMKFGPNHYVTRIARWYEQRYGKVAYAHMCVTESMHKELETNWQTEGKIMTVRDKPQSDFKRLTIDLVHRHFTFSLKMLEESIRATPEGEDFLGKYNDAKLGTLLTDADKDGLLIWRQDRPKLIVSSTSWTEDEDFSILLKAVELYEAAAKPSDPRLLFVITGNGPQKEHYLEKIKNMTFNKTRIITAWLETGDYPLLLGSADLGVSLHKSSSGMDLPMKVVDMFGCGLPACAVSFPW
jgi:beta-1,4-mannosyltransferase